MIWHIFNDSGVADDCWIYFDEKVLHKGKISKSKCPEDNKYNSPIFIVYDGALLNMFEYPPRGGDKTIENFNKLLDWKGYYHQSMTNNSVSVFKE